LINIALEAVFLNRTRSILTALGIVFGVAAVISMLAIGQGARKEIIEQIQMIGSRNIIITPIVADEGKDEAGDEGEQTKPSKYSPGLTLKDARAIQNLIPTVEKVSPEATYRLSVVFEENHITAQISGVQDAFFDVFHHEIDLGNGFTLQHYQHNSAVCIIGPEIESVLFKKKNPVGQYLKCGTVWLKVIGVLKHRAFDNRATEDFNLGNSNKNIYVPLSTLLVHFKDRSVVTSGLLQGNNSDGGSSVASFFTASPDHMGHNQLNKIIVQVKPDQSLKETQRLITKMMARRHHDNQDVEITVPELLLRQEQRTKNIFNVVLGAIASISLLVGGIGIMNIMLASVMERTREIGVRLAIGARKKDVVFQFLSEATIISFIGGLMGILLGVFLSKMITRIAEIATIVTWSSILISFVVSVSVGIAFGWMPARKAASQDPVESLRYE
jgi:putative ABC transport system permease protein